MIGLKLDVQSVDGACEFEWGIVAIVDDRNAGAYVEANIEGLVLPASDYKPLLHC
jgi:hypothetical protein